MALRGHRLLKHLSGISWLRCAIVTRMTKSCSGQNTSYSVRILQLVGSYIVGTAAGVPMLVADLLLQQVKASAVGVNECDRNYPSQLI